MSNNDVIRAWKDEEYRLGLSEAERALLPAHPAGAVEISDADPICVQAKWPISFICTGTLYC